MSHDEDSIKQPTFERKDCFGGCSIITTTELKGFITCLGDGVNATHILDQASHDKVTTDTKAKTGIWFDTDADAFKCQLSNNDINSSVNSYPSLVGVTCRRPEECGLMQQRLRRVNEI